MKNTDRLPLPWEILPHRYPLLLIDQITDYQPGALKAIKLVSYNEPYFQGHFPGLAIVPGVYLIEMMAQASAALYRLDRLQSKKDQPPPVPGRFAAIDKLRFLREVYPGEKLSIETRVKQRVGGLARFEVQILSESNLVAEGIIVLVAPDDGLPNKVKRVNHREQKDID